MRDTTKLEAVDVRSFARSLGRQRRVVYVSVAAFAVLGLCLNQFIPPAYRATVRMEIRRPLDRSPLTGQVLGSPGYQSENLTMLTAAEQITTRGLLDRVADDFSAQGWIRTIPSPVSDQSDLAWLVRMLRVPIASASGRSPRTADPMGVGMLNGKVAWLRTIIKVEPVPDTRLVDLRVDHRSPDAAVAIADRLSQLYVADQWRRSADADTSGLVLLRSQLERMRSRISGAADEGRWENLGRVAAVQERIRQLTETIIQQNADYLKAMSDYGAVKARLERLDAGSAGSSELLAGNPALDAIQRDLQNCRVQLVAARAVYKDKHPKLLALESQYEALQASLRRQQDQALGGLKAEGDVNAEHARSLKAALDQSRRELAAAEAEAQRYAAGQSALKTDQDLYALMLAKVQEGRMEGLMKTPPVEIVDAATLAPHPVRPRKLLNLAVCLLTGLFLGSGLALLRDSMNRKIATPQEVEEQLDLPLLGVVPKEN